MAVAHSVHRSPQLLKIKRSTLGEIINRCGLGIPSAAPAAEEPRELRLATA
jgi:hypothetical protein